mmetsp:Transcript_22485/g.41276  ORF Transcript_22485/g.41276 Transcript_22485/m.41276 type:complete len:471 (-) Transcript_22485:25-1437(-)
MTHHRAKKKFGSRNYYSTLFNYPILHSLFATIHLSSKSAILLALSFGFLGNVALIMRFSSTSLSRAVQHLPDPIHYDITIRHFPRSIYFSEGSYNQSSLISDQQENMIQKRRIHIDEENRIKRKEIEDDKNYLHTHEQVYEEECIPMSSWQETSFPNCNSIHEIGYSEKIHSNEFRYVASGGFNDVFQVQDRYEGLDPSLAMKILSPKRSPFFLALPIGSQYNDHNFDRARQDALIVERLTKSPYVPDIYGYCGFASVVPFADSRRSLENMLVHHKIYFGNLSPIIQLKYAVDAAKGLAAVHGIDDEYLSSVAHGDLSISQYNMFINGTLRLADFNQGALLRRNYTAPDMACKLEGSLHPVDRDRSPEEYAQRPRTSAIDVWALDSIFYHMLTGKKVWSEKKGWSGLLESRKLTIEGNLPSIDGAILNSTDPVKQALKKALDMCYIYEPSERGTAKEVATYLEKRYEDLK